jgi:hypothetical protein
VAVFVNNSVEFMGLNIRSLEFHEVCICSVKEGRND